MFRRLVADRLLANEVAPGYVRPSYDDYCFANVPATVGSLLDVDLDGPTLPDDVFETTSDVETVVVVVVDGFGYEQWKRHHADHEFFTLLTDRTAVTPLTSIYPSETAAAIEPIETYHSARTPVEHGLIGWNIYVDECDTVIESLPFQTKGEVDAGEALGITPDILKEGESVAEQFVSEGVELWQVMPEPIIGDSDSATVPFTPVPYDGLDEFTAGLRNAIQIADSGYVFAYLPQIDAAAHEVGTDGDEYRTTLAEIAVALDQSILGLAEETRERTLLAVTADHGHVDTDPERNVDLLEFDAIAEHVGTDAHGTPLFGGSPRNVHLYLDGTDPERVRDEMAAKLGTEYQALVLTREDALAEGLFGPGEPSETFTRQCGDVLVVPHDLGMWHGGEPDELEQIGMHGGLHPNEQLVPFAAVRLDALCD